MSKSVRVSEEFYEFIAAHNRAEESMEATLRRLIGGPHPEDVADILSSETAANMRDILEAKGESEIDDKRDL